MTTNDPDRFEQSKATPRDLAKLSVRQLKDEAEALQTRDIVDGAALAAIDDELRLRKAGRAARQR